MRPIVLAAWLLLGGLFARADVVEVLVLQTADLHGAVGTPTLPDEGDWLRLLPTIHRLREAHGPDRTLLIDCGDTCQGSAAARTSAGAVGIAMLQRQQVDVWVPGNHDLDFGPAQLLRWCRESGMPVLCGNLVLRPGRQCLAFPAWRCFERGGARIAVIGATASYLRHWTGGTTARQIEVTTAAAVLDRVLPDILATEPDLVVLATHQGWLESDPRQINEVNDLAQRYPEIDLILGAHTHRAIPGLRIGPTAWYVQPGALATHVAAVRARLDTAAHRVVELSSELVPADAAPSLDPGPEIRAMLAKTAAEAGEVVCHLPAAIPCGGTPGVSCALSELLCRALAEAADAEVVLHGTLGRSGLPAGPVTERDLFAIVPYENNVTLAELTTAELEVVVAEQLASRTSYVYSGLWGVEAAIVEGDAERPPGVRLGAADAPAPPPGKRWRVAMNSHTAGGAGGRFPLLVDILKRPRVRCRHTGIETRGAVRRYLQRHAGEPVEPRRWIRGRLAAFDRP
ncbi:MAG: hypothetical protein GX595_20935 [Lentisphaerae bacterium]|nr:hypothetical protein [Lentisphaerota bacterium]